MEPIVVAKTLPASQNGVFGFSRFGSAISVLYYAEWPIHVECREEAVAGNYDLCEECCRRKKNVAKQMNRFPVGDGLCHLNV